MAKKPAPRKRPGAIRKSTAGRAKGGKDSIKQAEFLAAYERLGNVAGAAQVAGVNRTSHYLWMKDPKYAEKFQTAHEQAIDALEKEARRRAVEGFDEPVYFKGEMAGTIRKYSDTLLIFLLKGARPEKFRENHRVQVEGQMNHTGNVQIYIPDNNRD